MRAGNTDRVIELGKLRDLAKRATAETPAPAAGATDAAAPSEKGGVAKPAK